MAEGFSPSWRTFVGAFTLGVRFADVCVHATGYTVFTRINTRTQLLNIWVSDTALGFCCHLGMLPIEWLVWDHKKCTHTST
jgi:hypothetical protein